MTGPDEFLEKGREAYKGGDGATAVLIMRSLAKQGHAHAQLLFGFMHSFGQGVEQNHQEAMKWFHKSAEQGYADAQDWLGEIYAEGFEGLDIPQNYVLSHFWYSLAATSQPPGKKRDKAVKYRDLAEAKMTPAQVSEAQRLARDWKPK